MDLVLSEQERRLVLHMRAMDGESRGDIEAIAAGYAKDFPERRHLKLLPSALVKGGKAAN